MQLHSEWFLWCKDNTYYTLHGAIDDATGKIVGLYMTVPEGTYGYYEGLEHAPREIWCSEGNLLKIKPQYSA